MTKLSISFNSILNTTPVFTNVHSIWNVATQALAAVLVMTVKTPLTSLSGTRFKC